MLNRTTPPERTIFLSSLNINAANLALLVKNLALSMPDDKQASISGQPKNLLMMLGENKIELNWPAFESYLDANFNPKTKIDRILYARKYADLLLNRDLSPLLNMGPDKRIHIMKCLATLAKHLGCYEDWCQLKKQSGIKWGNPDAALLAFEKITNQENGHVDDMEGWYKRAVEKLPAKYARFIQYNVQCGLRPAEAMQSMRLLYSEPTLYYRNGLLQHFKYPKIFLRRTKKAYVSILTESMKRLAEQYEPINYNALRSKLQREGLGCRVEYCRQIFATRLRQASIETELIDLLQGRLPQNVFLRHYYRPNFKVEIAKIRDIIDRQIAVN